MATPNSQPIEAPKSSKSAAAPMRLWVPALAIAAVMLLPPVYLTIRALGGGLELWALLFTTGTLAILLRTLALVVIVTAASALLAVPIAWLTVRTDLPLRGAIAIVTALPLVIPSYVFALLAVVALGPKGMVQGWLAPLGVERLPEIFGLPGAAITLTLLSYPYILLPVRAALYRIDPAVEEASRGLGQGSWTTFFRVTLPLLRPSIVAGGLLVALYTLSDFGAVSLMRFQTFTWTIFIQYESAFDRTLAAGLSLVLVALALAVLFAESQTRTAARYYRITPGTASDAHVVSLGKWRWPAILFVSSIVGMALAAPMAILGFWIVRGLRAGEALDTLWSAAWGSLSVSVLAAIAAALVALPIAVLTIRFPSWRSDLIERLTYVGFALPGVTVALAFVFFASSVARPIYQTTFLLIVAYVVLFLPAAVGAIETSLRQINPHVEEAARSLGRTPLQTFRTITLPLLMRGVLAGVALVFLLTMKELPVTLILSPTGFGTLATATWNAASEAFFARAALPSLLLILLSSIPMAFLTSRDRRGT